MVPACSGVSMVVVGVRVVGAGVQGGGYRYWVLGALPGMGTSLRNYTNNGQILVHP